MYVHTLVYNKLNCLCIRHKRGICVYKCMLCVSVYIYTCACGCMCSAIIFSEKSLDITFSHPSFQGGDCNGTDL